MIEAKLFGEGDGKVINVLPHPSTLSKAAFLAVQIQADTGELCGQYSIQDDFIHLSHANGVYLLEDRLCILAVNHPFLTLGHRQSWRACFNP